jgi:hypothetical protein
MFKVIRKVTGTREKANVPAGLVVTPTKGIIRLTQPLVDALSVNDKDYVMIVLAENESGDKDLYFGVAPLAADKEDQTGAKLSSIGSGLQFSDSAAYVNLEGNSEVNRLFSLDLEDGQEHEGMTFYKLVFSEETAKMARTKSGEEVEE